jgi:hypothetical protein
MKSRAAAIAGSIVAVAFAATPVTAFAATAPHHRPATESRLDRSRDARGLRHADQSRDASKDRVDDSREMLDR